MSATPQDPEKAQIPSDPIPSSSNTIAASDSGHPLEKTSSGTDTDAPGPEEQERQAPQALAKDDNLAERGDEHTMRNDNDDDDEIVRSPAEMGQEKDPFEVCFEGGDRAPDSPRSKPRWRKWVIVYITACCSFCVTSGSSIYTSTYVQMEAKFHNSREISNLGLSLFVLGISLGPMFLSPMSEFYGRRPIYLVSWFLYTIWWIPQAVAQNIQTLMVIRFLNGFSGSAFLAVAAGTVGDLFAKDDLQMPMAIFSIAPFIGPVAGPLVGGFINEYTNWRWTYWVMFIWAFVMFILLIFLVPETYHPIVLKNKARRLRMETGDDRWVAPTEKTQKSVTRALGISLLRPFQLLIFEPMCLNLCFFSAILLGIIYLFFVAFPLVFETNHGFSLWEVGLSFMGIVVGMLCGLATDSFWYKLRLKLIAKAGKTEPEFRLPPTIAGAMLAPIGLFWFAWTTYKSVHWIVPIIGSGFFGAGLFLSFSGIFTFLVDAYPAYAASALAANTFLRCLFAAVFPLFGDQMFEGLGFQWASTLLAFLTLAMAPFPWLFFKYGKKIRSKSRYAKS